MQRRIEFSVILETLTLCEGGSPERFRNVLAAAAAVAEQANAEVLVADVCNSAKIEKMLEREFPRIKRVAAAGLGYDQAKSKAAEQASGPYLLFLDGDCIPEPDWHERLLAALRSGAVSACCGYTRYEGGFLAAVFSIMDFGFFYPLTARSVGCYASNNSAFRRDLLERVPVPEAGMRCGCFYHAQLLLRSGTPVWLVPEARVLHEMPPLARERWRQGYDVVAARRADPEVRGARWLGWGLLSLPLFYAMEVMHDWKRVVVGRRSLGLSGWQATAALALFPILRLLDAAGMARALLAGGEGRPPFPPAIRDGVEKPSP
jgi:hypothetical protein